MDAHPGPPNSLRNDLPIRRIKGEWFRSFDSAYGNSGAVYFGKSTFRFNSPNKSFGVMYVSATLNGMFIETFGRNQRRWATQKFMESKSIALLQSNVLSLADITGRGLSAIGADGRLNTGDYRIAQRWAAWIHRHAHVDGILYRSRHHPDCECAAIFDRAKAKFRIRSKYSLATRSGKLLLVPSMRYYGFKIRKSSRP